MNRYNNYHKHTHYSSIFTPDSNSKTRDYINRCLELGEQNYFTTEHGFGGDIFESRALCDENNLNCKFGMEGYIVPNPLEKDNRNYHIILIPKTNIARKKLNLASSHANTDGYYYRPRLFLDDLLNDFDSDELYITTSCCAGLLKDDDSINDIFYPLYEKFGKNLFLEVQTHNVDIQKAINEKALQLKKELGLKLIGANDSHYIYPNQAKERLELLKGKGITYGDEDAFILDYPDYDTMVNRFKSQDILSIAEINEAMETTLVFDECENIDIDKTVKMPTLYPNLSEQEKIDLLKKEINKGFKRVMKEDEIPQEKRQLYITECQKEMQVIIDTEPVHSCDYFLLNKRIVDKAVNEYGGVLTRTGRGCFTDKAYVLTQTDIKPISKINVGEKVLGKDCKWHNVLNTYEYDIQEDLIEFEYERQGSRDYLKNQCTLDHKILVNRDGNIQYIQAKDLTVGDLLCSPKIKHSNNDEIIIDLQNYNKFGYKYDDEYIYEVTNIPNEYKYSPRWCERNIGVNSNFCKKIINGYKPQRKDSIEIAKKLLDNTPFDTLENYSEYCKSKYKIHRKIKRFIKLDELWNLFIGMMYGDGWTQKDYGIGLATNRTTKNGLNKWVTYKIANRLNLQDHIYVNSSKTKNLDQITINSHIVNEWFAQMFFKSEKRKDKIFNDILFTQNKQMLKWLLIGLKRTDGSISENRENFDSTSTSLISAYKILDNIVNQDTIKPHSLCIRKGGIDKRGYNNKQSYKLRTNKNIETTKKNYRYIENDDNYWYLKVENVTILKNQKTKVYDLEIENCHSYTINNIVVHNSCGSFLINKMLGITQIDRLSVDLPIYSERFMSTARLLENRSMPDIDFNIDRQEPFVQATRDLLGQDQCFPMIAYGTMQEAEAFRNICRSADLNYDEYNEVGKSLDAYRNDSKWKPYIDESQKYIGTIISASVHPCSHLVGNYNIKEELGVIKIGDAICVPMTSGEADEWKYLKEDFLIVSVWDIIAKTFNLIGKPIITLHNLLKEIKDDKRIWDLFEEGYTCTLNQFDTDISTNYTKVFKPKTMEECAMMTSAIRPSFDNFRNDFIHRRPYTTGSDDLDKLFEQTYSFILFQESIMKFFEWLGVSPAESIGLIKKISKKKIKQKDFDNLESRIKEQWKKNVGTYDGFEKVWGDMQASLNYSYNSPHGLATACDALYGAYLKVNYPLEYYTVVLNTYSDNKEKTTRLSEELKHFGVTLNNNVKFRMSSNDYSFNKSTNTIYKGVGSIKNIGKSCGNNLYSLKDNDYPTFISLLHDIKTNSLANKTEKDILIKINYFSEFGDITKLLYLNELYEKYGTRKTFKKKELSDTCPITTDLLIRFSDKETDKQYSGVDMISLLSYLEQHLEWDKETSKLDHMCYEVALLGYTNTTDESLEENYAIVSNTDSNKYGTIFLSLYSPKYGVVEQYKVDKKWYYQFPCDIGDLLRVNIIESYKRTKNSDGEWVKSDDTELKIQSYYIVKKFDK